MRTRGLPFLLALALAGCPDSGTPGLGGLDLKPFSDSPGNDLPGEDPSPTRDLPGDSPAPYELPAQDFPGPRDQGGGIDVHFPEDLPQPLCQPCRSDLDCRTEDVEAPCLAYGPDGSFCGYPCGKDADCPEGFLCTRDDLHGRQCKPVTGASCPCLPRFRSAGFLTECYRENETGRCSATRTCDQACPAPIPDRETCNGIDDDCNGQTDEGLGSTTCGTGVCERTVQNCLSGTPRECIPGNPAPEACNLLDDDCDGQTDNMPDIVCGVGACLRSVPACIDGRPQACYPLPPEPEVCNAIDDDCNGLVDDGFQMETCGVGACQRTVSQCQDGQSAHCVPGDPVPEVCNRIDDDCNGEVDDMPPVTCGLGECAVTVPACIDGKPRTCVPKDPRPEVCNGKDDNCDGRTDEDFGVGSLCDGPDADLCAEGRVACGSNGEAFCNEPGTGRTESCNGRDDNCDGQIDETGCPQACTRKTWQNHVYLFCNTKARWTVARDTCAGWNYHLVKIENAAENTFVTDTAYSVSTEPWWIGLNDLGREGTYVWADGSAASWFQWGPDQPNNGGLWPNNQDCVLVLEPAWGRDGRAYWNDAECGTDGNRGDMYRFVCETP
ncbi:C-type lectin domain-containing protein [Myxococcota bacterium]|nr:C-type lectin domain-containing protein [Myxococcota bacterium]